jgi:hypothetical protein
MAYGDWGYTYSTTATNTGYSNSISTTYTMPVTFAPLPEPPVPAPQAPLEWLDGEIEKTCALARVAA